MSRARSKSSLCQGRKPAGNMARLSFSGAHVACSATFLAAQSTYQSRLQHLLCQSQAEHEHILRTVHIRTAKGVKRLEQ